MRGWTQLLLPNHWNRRRNRLVSRCEFGSARSHRLDESRRWVKNIVLVDPDHTRVALREKQMLRTTLTAVALSAALVMDIDTDLRLEGAGMVLAQAEIRIPSDSQLERLERRGLTIVMPVRPCSAHSRAKRSASAAVCAWTRTNAPSSPALWPVISNAMAV